MRKLLVIVLLAIAPVIVSASDDGLISKKSNHSVKATLDRLENILKKKRSMAYLTYMDVLTPRMHGRIRVMCLSREQG